ncbi:helix-hairpin-helix domain-containing protein [Haliscomenobacter hydrossis]|uniref:DNA uptake protein and related DNA-binding protein-like protein n=1 Tax=Haliscomenobacter hydrossis (strain ATCC 27775 / DSM 1100 / LMG 10767 / O) TaxID=760192 RepID=F4KS68_HALH1|nr:helix-hairpin-helix domain-containing protein [Haliscomenobacter hydrossis]AEE52313.1 DNA uptake protein and related DNA-binding protein-like protein [Haliscomenobacter hydrossis DSM 1100]
MKKLLDFFYYTKAERRACVMLLILCTTAFLLPEWIDFETPEDLTVLEAAPRPIQAKMAPRYHQKEPRYGKSSYPKRYPVKVDKAIKFFPFDPNTITASELQQLGLSARTAAIWVKYSGKGGRFRKPEDVQKVYGLPPDWYPKALPFMRITRAEESVYAASSTENTPFRSYPDDKPGRKDSKPCTPIDVNASDTSAWQSLRGIGPVLASRIVKFRDKLGGFYALEQVRETYGLADSVFQKILPCLTLGNPGLKPLLINQATLNELATHPYIGFKAARGILNWKDQHGPFTKPEHLEEVVALEKQKLERLRPYLQF